MSRFGSFGRCFTEDSCSLDPQCEFYHDCRLETSGLDRATAHRAYYAYVTVMQHEGHRMLPWSELEPETRDAFIAFAAECRNALQRGSGRDG